LGGGGICPVNKGLGEADGEVEFSVSNNINSSGNAIIRGRIESVVFPQKKIAKIKVTALDNFAREQNLKKIDFIKADIEGAERDMLKGAYGVLKEYAPKLALCTYHLPDDPEVLGSLIKDANPNYRVAHISKKLFAAVCK
jgi:FkbM family methyltransferase